LVGGDEHRPEDWVASVTERYGATDGEGLSRLPDGRLLRDAVIADPLAWLGPEHVEVFGSDTALLVKLLDAGERLPVHLHPGRHFASEHLGSVHGKTEAWVMIAAEGAEASVWLGFRRDVGADELASWVRHQRTGALLDSLHRLDLVRGEGVLVPAQVPHAIGAGVFCLEVQEPTDFSLNLEWEGFDLPSGSDGQLGLDLDLILSCVRTSALGADELAALRVPPLERSGTRSALPACAADFFSIERVRPGNSAEPLDASFSVLIVVSGRGTMRWGDRQVQPLSAGDVMVVPWAAGRGEIEGTVEVLRAKPPSAAARLISGNPASI